MALSASPAVAAPASRQTVRVEGVVTGDFQWTDQEYNPPGLYRPDAFRSSDHDPLVIGLTLPG
ncbi:hypothetical protein ACIHFD_30830 [Nonomuraea sp. NPDC051941]|uniref:hypothetical protein n=1 Tax=Nonomuraea sp. NPDC051941 TaxID=3364373 RepID=UPI0037C796B7